MIVCQCLYKERDKNGKIVRYVLQDMCRHTCIMEPAEVKSGIVNKQLDVLNLTLTTDNRLVDSFDSFHPMGIKLTDNIDGANNMMSGNQFLEANKVYTDPGHLKGWMNSDNTEYAESISGIPGGILHVSAFDWRIHLQPEKSKRVGAWVNPGYTINSAGLDRFCDLMTIGYRGAIAKMHKNPKDNWRYEDNLELVYTFRPAIFGTNHVDLWLKFSQVYIKDEGELEKFISKIKGCETRVAEIRE